jgi:hypothetical protein
LDLSQENKRVKPAGSFIPKRVDRIGHCGFDAMIAYCEKSNSKCQYSGKSKNPKADPYPVGELLKPSIHGKIGKGPGDDVGEDNPFRETFGEMQNNVWDRCTQDLPDAYLLGFQISHEGSQAEQA